MECNGTIWANELDGRLCGAADLQHNAMKRNDTCRNAAPMLGGGEFEEKRLFVFENCFIFVLMLNKLLD